MKTKDRTAKSRVPGKRLKGLKSDEKTLNTSWRGMPHGLSGHAVVLPGEDAQEYSRYRQRWFDELQPADDAERCLVQTLVEASWRLRRASALAISLCSAAAHSDSDLLRALERLSFYEEKINRVFHNSLDMLLKMQKNRKEQKELWPRVVTFDPGRKTAKRNFSFWIDQIDPSKPPN